MKKIEVQCLAWGQAWHFGTLADNGTQLLFEYSKEALARGVEFSPRMLKLRTDAYGDFPEHQFRLPGIVADALPDGWGLLLMERMLTKLGFERSRISPLDRLAFMGDRTMGSLVFHPPINVELNSVDMALIDLARESKIEISGQESEALEQLILLGGSPHGARPKALVHYDFDTNQMSTFDQSIGNPWLVKFQAKNEHKEVCAIEDLYAQFARQCLLDMPNTKYFDIGSDMAGFGIERFDREKGQRVPIHTLAGFLNADFRLPSVGYETFLRATRMLTQSHREVEKAFERCVFNVIFNNRDDHAKNFSYRMGSDFRWRLAPCYDLTYNEGPGGEHQMDIKGEGRLPTKKHLLSLALANDLKLDWAASVIERIALIAGTFLTEAKNHDIRLKTVQLISRKLEENRSRMI